MKRVVLHVDRLVLHDIDRTDAQALSAGLQAGQAIAGGIVKGAAR